MNKYVGLTEPSAGHSVRPGVRDDPAVEESSVSPAVLSAHDDVHHRVGTRGRIHEEVSRHVQHRLASFHSEHLDQGDGEVADDEVGQDDDDHVQKTHVPRG